MFYRKYMDTASLLSGTYLESKLMQLSPLENLLLDSEIISHLHRELISIFRKKYKNYFNLINLTLEMEHHMLEKNFMRFMINDILSTEEYSLEGIALYTDTPLDVVTEFSAGVKTNPSANFFLKVIALHRTVRPSLYKDFMSKFKPEEPETTE